MKKVIITAAIIFVAIISGVIVINMISRKDTDTDTSVGMLLIGAKDDKSYNQTHYDGIMRSADTLGLNVIVREQVPTDESSVAVMEQLINDGCQIIICDSFAYGEYIERAAAKHPDVYFYHATGTGSGKNLASFFGRMYQMRYLCGIAAGLRTETNEIGYIAAFDISEVNRGINAFTLGVRSVNPDAVVYVDWCGSWTGEDEAAQSFERLTSKHNIDTIAMHTDALSPLRLAEERGIWSIGYNIDNGEDFPNTYLTSAVWRWENFYTPQLSNCLQHNFVGKHYWESAETGIVALAPFTENVAAGTASAVEREDKRIKSGTFDVFYGPIRDNEGNERVAAGENMSDNAMLNKFDWYVEGVVVD